MKCWKRPCKYLKPLNSIQGLRIIENPIFNLETNYKTMKKARLELNQINISLNKERWNLYFVLVTEIPGETNRSAMTIIPEGNTIPLRKKSGNNLYFKAEGEGTEGLFLLETTVPKDKTLKARMYMMHSRQFLRDVGKTISDLHKLAEDNTLVLEVLTSLKSTNPYWIVADKGLDFVEALLRKTKDRNLGFISLDEDFGSEFSTSSYQKRTNQLSSGGAKMDWAWKTE